MPLSLTCGLHGRLLVVMLFKSRSNLLRKNIWVQPRSRDWWNFVTSSSSDSSWWHSNLHMSRSTFNYICSQLSPYIQKQSTQMHECVLVEQQVALTLLIFILFSQLFGLGHSTVCKIFHQCCCSIISEKLRPRFVQISIGDDLKRDYWGIEVVGAINGSQIPITRPTHNELDYYNRKGFYLISGRLPLYVHWYMCGVAW